MLLLRDGSSICICVRPPLPATRRSIISAAAYSMIVRNHPTTILRILSSTFDLQLCFKRLDLGILRSIRSHRVPNGLMLREEKRGRRGCQRTLILDRGRRRALCRWFDTTPSGDRYFSITHSTDGPRESENLIQRSEFLQKK